MSNNTPIAWEHLPWDEIPDALARCAGTVLLPVGATEQHGPHLGTGVDTTIAAALCREVSARTGAPYLPPLPYGCSLGHSRRWPGTLSLSPETLIRVVSEIGDWLVASGVRRLFMVNGHVTNFAPLRCALEVLRARHDTLMVSLVGTATVSERVRAACSADAQDWHANEAETSLVLALEPRMHRPGKAIDDPDRTNGLVFAHPVNRTSTNGVTGFPSHASLAAGAEVFEWMAADLAALVKRGMGEEPPLPHSWHTPL